MTHDTDPTELTPPDGTRASLHPEYPPLTAEQQQQLRVDYQLLLGEVRTIRRLWINDDGEMVCPVQGAKCAALDMAETATIGVAELARGRHILTAVIGASALILAAAIGTGGTLIVNRASAVAREQAEATAMRMIRDQQRTTESIVNDAAKQGALIGLREFVATQPVPPLVVRK